MTLRKIALSPISKQPPGVEILDRLGALGKQQILLDAPAVERALTGHFQALGLPVPAIQWVGDACEGYAAAAGGLPHQSWQDEEVLSSIEAGRLAAAPSWTSTEEQPVLMRENLPRCIAWNSGWSEAEWLVVETARSIASIRNSHRSRRFLPSRAVPRSSALCATLAVEWKPRMRKRTRAWRPFLEATEAGLWVFWILENRLIALGRPEISTARHQLHCHDGPVVRWPNGRLWWAWRGVLVPRRVVLAPETFTVDRIRRERNVEVRRVMLERFGAERFLREAGAEVVNSDDFGTLYRAAVADDEPLVMVKVLNSTPENDGRIKEYFLRVPPRVRTAREGIAWTFRLSATEYGPLIQT